MVRQKTLRAWCAETADQVTNKSLVHCRHCFVRRFNAGGFRRDSDDGDHPLQGWGFSSPAWETAYR